VQGVAVFGIEGDDQFSLWVRDVRSAGTGQALRAGARRLMRQAETERAFPSPWFEKASATNTQKNRDWWRGIGHQNDPRSWAKSRRLPQLVLLGWL